jgi:SAM-dependent methyltransferase
LSAAKSAAGSTELAKVSQPCHHCGANERDLLWSGREHEYDTTNETFSFVRCPNCGLVRLDPRPDVSELPRIYPPNYYAYNLVSGETVPPRRLTERMKMRMYQRRFAEIVNGLGKEGTIRVLDVGCGDGRLLDYYRASEVGDRIETHGIDFDEQAVATARASGHRVVSGRFEQDTELEPGSFDVVIALHVIEHVDDPEGFARRGAELLAPGGVFVIATPNWDSADARRFRGHWGGNHFPRHWTLYDEATIRDLAGDIGLDVAEVEYQPNPIFWVWSCHSWASDRFPRNNWPDRVFPPISIFQSSLHSFLLLTIFTLVDAVLARATGRTASMAVHLRKPPV